MRLSVLIFLSFSSLVVLPAWADAPPPSPPLQMDDLVRRVLDLDPSLEDLRIDLGVSEGRARAIRYWEDPQLRFYYTRKGDERVPGPYTESVRRTTTERGNETMTASSTRLTSSDETRNSLIDGTEFRSKQDVRSGGERQVESFSGRKTEVTTREYIPRRDGVSIRETTRIQSRETASRDTAGAYAESGQEARSRDLGTIRRTGSASLREHEARRTSGQAIRTEETERWYAQSPYEGSDQYSIQLRLQPQNPWEVSRLIKQARAEISLAEFELQSKQAQIAAEVRKEFREASAAHRLFLLEQKRLELRKRDLAFFEARKAAGTPVIRQIAEKKAACTRAMMRLRRAQQQRDALCHALAARAGITGATRIAVRAEPAHITGLRAEDTPRVLQATLGTHPELARMALQLKAHEFGLDAARAARIPWLTILAIEASYEEQFGEKVRNDYGIFAGVSLPVFSWMDGDLGAENKRGMEVLKSRMERLQGQMEARVSSLLQRLVEADQSLADIREESRIQGKEWDSARHELPGENEDTHRAAIAMEEMLLEIQELEIDAEEQQADAILALEQALGTDVRFLKPANTPPPQ